MLEFGELVLVRLPEGSGNIQLSHSDTEIEARARQTLSGNFACVTLKPSAHITEKTAARLTPAPQFREADPSTNFQPSQ